MASQGTKINWSLTVCNCSSVNDGTGPHQLVHAQIPWKLHLNEFWHVMDQFHYDTKVMIATHPKHLPTSILLLSHPGILTLQDPVLSHPALHGVRSMLSSTCYTIMASAKLPSGVTNSASTISLYSSAVFFSPLDTLPVISLENPKA